MPQITRGGRPGKRGFKSRPPDSLALILPMEIAFTVPGPPVPKQRARRGRGGRWYTPEATVAYEQKVGWLARAAGLRRPWTGQVRVELALWMPDRRRVDLDNLAKCTMDALTGIAWTDDSQIRDLRVFSGVDRDRPRAEIWIQELA